MTPKTYNIKFAGIELLHKSMKEPTKTLDPNDKFTFNFLADLKVAPPIKVAGVVTDVTIINEEGQEIAHFKIMCVFELPEFDEIFTKAEENKYDTPVDLEIILKATGISTIRGVIFSELRGTYLQGAIMPLIDMATIIKEQRKKAEEEKTNA